MIESARGVVLRTRRLTESSLIVRWLTDSAGRVATVAKGARRAKSPLAGRLDLFVEADFTFRRSTRSELHLLGEVAVLDYHPALRTDLRRLQVAAYCSTLLEQTTETDTPLPGFYALYTGLLGQLCRDTARPRWVYAFELRLLDALGLSPTASRTRLKTASRELLITLTQGSWPEIQAIQPPPEAVKELNAFLRGFLARHLDRAPKARSETLRMLSG